MGKLQSKHGEAPRAGAGGGRGARGGAGGRGGLGVLTDPPSPARPPQPPSGERAPKVSGGGLPGGTPSPAPSRPRGGGVAAGSPGARRSPLGPEPRARGRAETGLGARRAGGRPQGAAPAGLTARPLPSRVPAPPVGPRRQLRGARAPEWPQRRGGGCAARWRGAPRAGRAGRRGRGRGRGRGQRRAASGPRPRPGPEGTGRGGRGCDARSAESACPPAASGPGRGSRAPSTAGGGLGEGPDLLRGRWLHGKDGLSGRPLRPSAGW